MTAVHAACRGRLKCRFGAGHGEERAWNMELMSVTVEVSKVSSWLKAFASRNMPLMSVTLEVSKLSGRLNADAFCRESKAGNAMQGCAGDGWTVDWGQSTRRSAR